MSKGLEDNTKKPSSVAYFVFGLAILVILVVGLFGNSIKDNLFIRGDTGRIIIDRLEAGSSVYIDKLESKTVGSLEENVKLKKLSVGTHSILIVRPGFWPWLKEVEVEKGETITLSPFSVPESHSGFFIGEGGSEYSDLISQFETVTAPSFENRLVSNDGNFSFWVDENTLFAEWLGPEEEIPETFCSEDECSPVTIPLTVGGDIRNVDFYKDRSGVLIVSFGRGVFAIEVDNEGHQNFQPIFEGDSPNFLTKDEGAVYVLDGDVLREITL